MFVRNAPGGRARLEHTFARVEGPDLGQRSIKELRHRLGATTEDRIQRITAGQGQADIGAEGGEAGLLEGGPGGCALALDRVTDASFKSVGTQAGFDQ